MAADSYKVERTEAQPIRFAGIRTRAPFSQLASTIAPAFEELYRFLDANNVADRGHNLIYYVSVQRELGEPVFDFWCGVETKADIPPAGHIAVVETPGGPVVTTTHAGAYSGLPDAHQSISSWAEENKVRLTHVNWEIYGDMDMEHPERMSTSVVYEIARD
jgi:effector-binding domain-containing protein